MENKNVCDTCNKFKDVCCGFDESLNDFNHPGDKAPAQCKECCPQRVEHTLQKLYGVTGSRLCECLEKVGKYEIVLQRSNSVLGHQVVIACNCCGQLHIRFKGTA